MINVRLDKKTENVVKEYATAHDVSKTMIVKEALAMYFSKKELAQNPFELGKDLFGTQSSGQSDLSQSYKSRLKDKLSAKYSH